MILIIYSLLNFLSAALIFFIQPLAAKTILPILGGAPFVWTGCMVFFQSVLLAGYIYAHCLNKYLKKNTAIFLHLTIFIAAILITIPLNLGSLSSGVAPNVNQLRWLLGSLLTVLGLPFFVISATSPLTQTWFAATKSKWQERPYMLYAASNLGSFAGLFAYPLLFEPLLNTRLQAQFVDCSFVLLFIFLASAGIILLKSPAVKIVAEKSEEVITFSKKLSWLFLALVPSGLLYSVSTYISTDLVSMPLLWVIPLAIYILSFVLVFSEKARGIGGSRVLHFGFAAMMILLSQTYFDLINFMLAMHLIALFIFCMVCHQKLYDRRPKDSGKLTVFYIILSIGGVTGGLLNVFVAPHIFNSVAEYPIFIFLSILIWLDFKKPTVSSINITLIITILLSIIFGILSYYYLDNVKTKIVITIILLYLSVLAAVICQKKPAIAIAAIIGVLISIKVLTMQSDAEIIHQDRNIFGISKVSDDSKNNIRIFTHGSTKHGIQRISGDGKLSPTAYYYALNNYFNQLPAALRDKPIAIVGEGAGTLACYGKKGQLVDLIEINQAVIDIANNYFTYIKDCPAEKKIFLGDGRIEMSKQPDGKYGVIMLDAFSSDSVPVHLITREAVAIYSKKLTNGGILFFNISNRYINFAPVLAAIADSLGLKAALLFYDPDEEAVKKLAYSSIWVAMSAKEETLKPLFQYDSNWKMLDKADKRYLWRDDYSNIIRSMIW